MRRMKCAKIVGDTPLTRTILNDNACPNTLRQRYREEEKREWKSAGKKGGDKREIRRMRRILSNAQDA
jgi:hypothetical protein